MLEVSQLRVRYGGIEALRGVTLRVEEGEVVALLGANGAGKTTTLKAIMGLVPVEEGSRVEFLGRDVTSPQTRELVAAGLTLVPEGRRVFPHMSVDENLRLGAFLRRDAEAVAADREEAFVLFPRLRERLRQLAGTLSGGEQQMLAVGRALMSRPKLLMLDEPSLGLAPLLVQEIMRTITRLHERGTTILLIEQNAKAALRIADRAYVLEGGRVVLEGTGEELQADDRVREAYLGGA